MARIMIVDENAAIRNLMTILVTHAGHEVVSEESNWNLVVHEYLRVKPDLIIVDYYMSMIDGISLIDQIKHVDSSSKILLCTNAFDKINNTYIELNLPIG